ncbi:hypothetical protein GN958_ATG09575 [Phytophthora infestans]|uniref:Uncharacterized protein n=1 Tax=Phytophthora infestans TaxID=4787 RepID=A0A8S9UPB8_PHYIN|nr:hypothetical protein GN958_ATG09575 [Phytophthora infestans]
MIRSHLDNAFATGSSNPISTIDLYPSAVAYVTPRRETTALTPVRFVLRIMAVPNMDVGQDDVAPGPDLPLLTVEDVRLTPSDIFALPTRILQARPPSGNITAGAAQLGLSPGPMQPASTNAVPGTQLPVPSPITVAYLVCCSSSNGPLKHQHRP